MQHEPEVVQAQRRRLIEAVGAALGQATVGEALVVAGLAAGRLLRALPAGDERIAGARLLADAIERGRSE